MKPKLSISTLLTNLVSSGPTKPMPSEEIPEGEKKVATTVRLEPATRFFVEQQAEHLGISAQEFIAMTLKSIMTATVNPPSSAVEEMADRFLHVFTGHGISVVDIPKLLPDSGITRAVLMDKSVLVDLITDEVLWQLANLFGAQPEWVKGTEVGGANRNCYRWYKNIGSVARRLAFSRSRYYSTRVLFTAEGAMSEYDLKHAREHDDKGDGLNVGVLIAQDVVEDGLSYCVYDVLEYERWNYSKCREHLKALMVFCEKASIPYDGVLLQAGDLGAMHYGRIMACDALRNKVGKWYPERLVRDDALVNPEFHEMEFVMATYDESGADRHVKACKRPSSVSDWDRYMLGEYD